MFVVVFVVIILVVVLVLLVLILMLFRLERGSISGGSDVARDVNVIGVPGKAIDVPGEGSSAPVHAKCAAQGVAVVCGPYVQFAGHGILYLVGHPAGVHVDDAADRAGAVKQGGGAFEYLDLVGYEGIH